MARAPADNPLADPAIVRAVSRVASAVQQCNPEHTGSLVMEWDVEPDGSVGNVHTISTTVSQTATACAINVISEAEFPEHDGDDAIDYCVPVLLDPSLRPRPERAASAN
jgi:hypothetical protein